MFQYEKDLLDKGIKYIAGVDEVGRGPLAGPLVVGAVILDLEKVFKAKEEVLINDIKSDYLRIKDSKQLSAKNRAELSLFLLKEVLSYSIIAIDHTQIDSIGIGKANQLGFSQSIEALNLKPEHILTDNFQIKTLPQSKQTNIVKGDAASITIAAASIIAKVYRDNLMIEWSKKYPLYGFERHKGYGTEEHIRNLYKYGPCELHRRSFEPVKSICKGKAGCKAGE